MKGVSIFLVCLLGLSIISTSQQSAIASQCFGQICPRGTTNCKQHKESSADRSRIEITVTCLDEFDGELKSFYYQEPSYLDPHTYYKNTKYETVYDNYLP